MNSKHVPGLIALAVVLVLGLAAPQSSRAAVVFYTDIVSFNAASVTALVEDFEVVPVAKDAPHPSFTANGITYTGINSPLAAPNVWVASPGYNNFGLPGPTASSVLTATGDEDYRLDFASPMTAVGFDTYLNAFGPATVQVFGSGGLLDTYVHSHDPATIGFLGITASEPITGIRWTTVLGRRINTGIDNILKGTAVPEPASLLLLGLGLAGLGLARRRAR